MSQFEAFFVDARAMLVDQHARPGVQYAPVDDPSHPFDCLGAIVSTEFDELLQQTDGRTLYRQRHITVPTSRAEGGIDIPIVRASRFIISGDPWSVDVVISVQAGLARVRVVKPVTTELAGHGNRPRKTMF